MQINFPQPVEQLQQTVTTNVAAKALNRKPQTLRTWSCTGKGPLSPIRINGRLAWPINQIAALLSPPTAGDGATESGAA